MARERATAAADPSPGRSDFVHAVNISNRIGHAASLYAAILSDPMPADRKMDTWFRARPELGMRDRGQIADDVYAMLRARRSLSWLCGADDADAGNVAAARLIVTGIDPAAMERAGFHAEAIAKRWRAYDPATLPTAVAFDMPDALQERFDSQWGPEQAQQLARALNLPATVDLRVNLIKCQRAQAAERLEAEGFPVTLTPFSPVGLRRHERASLFRTATFGDGWIEVQDEGSQLVALLVEPRRREMVADFCAGGGGKTLALGAMMANSGSLYAFDTSAARLQRLATRVKRAGLDNVRVATLAHENDDRVNRLAGKMDRVLVDAPCSGTGTLRRNPDIKWRPLDVARFVDVQTRILAAAARLVKPGGRLVYATCSLLNEENDGVVGAFLAEHTEFRPLSAQAILDRRGVDLKLDDDYLRLLPHRHGTDGFFAAVLARS